MLLEATISRNCIADIKLIIKDHCFSIWQQQYVSSSTACFLQFNHRSKFGKFSISLSLTNWSLQIKRSHASYWITQHRIMLNLFGSRECQPFLVNLSKIRTLKICFKFTSKFHGFASHNANTILYTSLFKFNKFRKNFGSNRLN